MILDSGTTLTYLPRSATAPLYRLLNVYDDTRVSGITYADCALRSRTDLFLTYQFGGPNGPVVNVSAAEMIMNDLQPYIEAGMATPRNLPFPRSRACRLGVMTADHEPPYLVGDTFLRSAYVVYDLSNNVIGMAQSNVNTTRSNIVEIEANGTVPVVTGVASATASQETGGGAGSDDGDQSGGNGRSDDEGSGDDKQNAAAGGLRQGLNWEVLGVAGLTCTFTLFGMGLFAL